MAKRRRPPPTGRTWATLRAQVLADAGHRCQIGMPGCTGNATQADHIVPIAQGGPRLARENLRAACASCNNRRGDGIRRGADTSDWRHWVGQKPRRRGRIAPPRHLTEPGGLRH